MIQNFFLLTKVSNINAFSTSEIVVLSLIAIAVLCEMVILMIDVTLMGITKNTARLAWWKWALCIFISAVGMTAGCLLHIACQADHNSLWYFSIALIISSIYACIILFIMLGFKIKNCVRAKKYFTTEERICDYYAIRAIIIRRVGKRFYKIYKSLPKEAKQKVKKFLATLLEKAKAIKSFKKTYSKKPDKVFDDIKNKIIQYAKKEFGL